MEVKKILPLEAKQNFTGIEAYWYKKLQSSRYWQKPLFWLGMAFIFAGSIFSLKEAKARIKAMPYFCIDYNQLKITRLPEWIRPFTEEITPGHLPQNLTIFDSTTILANAYLHNPWVRQVKEISKKYPNTIGVSLVLRRPVAIVLWNNFYYLVDADAVRLPGRYASPPSTSYFLPCIMGVMSEIPSPGKVWQDPYLKNSLQIISCLAKYHTLELLSITSVRIEPAPPHKMITLWTQDKKRILWGHSFASHLPFISPLQRVKALEKLYALCAEHIEFQKMDEVDIRFGYILTPPKPKRGAKRASRSS
jgi:hypothetical protein